MMATFVSMALQSDSESDDADFVPGAGKDSDDSASDVESGSVAKKNGKNKRKKQPKDQISRKRGGIFLEGSLEDKADQEKLRRAEFEEEKLERKEMEEKKKSDDLWADFQKDTRESSKSKSDQTKTIIKSNNSSTSKIAGGLGTFSSMGQTKRKKHLNSSNMAVKKFQTKSIMASIFDDFENKDSKNTEAELSVKDKFNKPQEPKSIISSIFETSKSCENNDNRKSVCNGDRDSVDLPTDTSQSGTTSTSVNTITITKTFDFAGENIEVTKEVDKDSKEAQKFLRGKQKLQTDQNNGGVPVQKKETVGGLSSIMGVIAGKTPKLGCLDKSKMDLEKYVDEVGIKEELKTHNKGKDGYVEKQMFLDRSDHRRFEIEKAAREKTRKPLNN